MARETDRIRNYIDTTFAPEPEWMKPVRAKGEELRPGMQISAHEGRILQFLCGMVNAHNILEIGCFMGYSALWMAGALPEGGMAHTCEINREYAGLARKHFAASPHAKKITLIEADTAQAAEQLKGKTFDVLFFDAEKKSYLDYLDRFLPQLRPGGLVIADNTLLFGHVMDTEPSGDVSKEAWRVMRAFNERLAKEFDAVMIPTAEGLTVGRKC